MNKILMLLCIACLMLTGCKENVDPKEAASEYPQMTSGEPQYSEVPNLGITEADVLLIRKKVEQVEADIFVSSNTWRCGENDEETVAIPSEESETGFEFYYMCDKFDTREKIMSYLTTELTIKNAQDEIRARIDSRLLAEMNGKMSIVPWEGTDTEDWDNAKVINFQVGDKNAEATIQVFDVAFNTYDTYVGSYIYENGWKEDSLKVNRTTNRNDLVSIDTLKGAVTIPNGLMVFLKELSHNKEDTSLIQILSEDLDGDGHTEYVVSYGPDAELYETSYVIRDNQSDYQLLNPEIKSGGYSIFDISLIHLEGSEQSYIYTGITNGASLIGTGVYGVNGKDVTELYYGASATGEGEDQLEDEDKDGIFDKAVAYRNFQYHTMLSTSYWNGKTFDESVNSFKNDESGFVYPKSSETLIETYIEAVFLGAEEEIKEMTSPEMVSAFDVMVVFNDGGQFYYFYAFDDIQYKVIKSDDTTQIITMTKNNEDVQFTLNFDDVDGHWKIANIEGVAG